MTQAQVISYPIPFYSNPPINPQFYKPSQFFISGIILGRQTLVTTTKTCNYEIGQQVRFVIYKENGTRQLNGQTGYVIDVPSSNQVLVDIDSTSYDTFKSSTQAIIVFQNIGPAGPSIWSFNVFSLLGLSVFQIVPGSVVIHLPSVDFLIDQGDGTLLGLLFPLSDFGTVDYSTGDISITYFAPVPFDAQASLTYTIPQPLNSQILAIGNINSGNINASGNVNLGTFIPGSFINISPL